VREGTSHLKRSPDVRQEVTSFSELRPGKKEARGQHPNPRSRRP